MTGAAEMLAVLVVSNFYPPHIVGGAELVAHRQALALASRGHRVRVLAGAFPKSENDKGWLEREEVDGLTVFRLPIRSLDISDSFLWPAAAMRLRSILSSERFDIVHFHNIMGLGANLIPEAASSGAAVLVTLHDPWGICFKQTLLRNNGSLCTDTDGCSECLASIKPSDGGSLPIRLRRDYVAWALDHADTLLSPSHFLAQTYRAAGFRADRIVVQSNGIDLASFAPSRPRTPLPVRFLVLAYLGTHKGIPDLLDAAALLAAEADLEGCWRLDICGDGELRPLIEAQIAANRFGGAVGLLGWVGRNEVLTRLADTHVVVLPSRWPENEPVSLLEAIAAGCAQIATDLGGNTELIDDGLSGLLVPHNDPAALAQAMARYIRQPDLAAQHGAYNRTRANAFDELAAIDRLEHLYRGGAVAEPAASLDPPVVICGGGWPDLNTAAICAYLHWAEGSRRIRLLWHKWVTPTAWDRACLVWNWSGDDDPPLIRRAVRAGIPILAPAGSKVGSALADGFGLAELYRSPVEAISTLLLASARPTDASTAARTSAAADFAALMSPQSSFALGACRAV